MTNEIQEFMLLVIQERISPQGWVSFARLSEYGVRELFEGYCQKHGCTLTLHAGETCAPWSDFKNFLLGQHPDD